MSNNYIDPSGFYTITAYYALGIIKITVYYGNGTMKLTITGRIHLLSTYATVGGEILATVLTDNATIIVAIVSGAGSLYDKYGKYKTASVWASCNYKWGYYLV